MAFSPGDVVVMSDVVETFQNAFAANGLPLFGSVESDGGGNVVVVWANGTRTTVPNDGALSLLLLRSVSTLVIALYHQRVMIDPILGIPNPPADEKGQGASEGLVTAVFTLDANGGTDVAVVEFSGGDVWTLQASLFIPIG
jgi:hypothetical protein